jgi:hypothetical protein
VKDCSVKNIIVDPTEAWPLETIPSCMSRTGPNQAAPFNGCEFRSSRMESSSGLLMLTGCYRSRLEHQRQVR